MKTELVEITKNDDNLSLTLSVEYNGKKDQIYINTDWGVYEPWSGTFNESDFEKIKNLLDKTDIMKEFWDYRNGSGKLSERFEILLESAKFNF